jgi:hypothetical protein
LGPYGGPNCNLIELARIRAYFAAEFRANHTLKGQLIAVSDPPLNAGFFREPAGLLHPGGSGPMWASILP